MVEAGFEGIGKYITSRQKTAARCITLRPIMGLCERSAQRLGARVSQRLWKQGGLNFGGAKKEAEAVAAE